jgi:hypothetical protein
MKPDLVNVARPKFWLFVLSQFLRPEVSGAVEPSIGDKTAKWIAVAVFALLRTFFLNERFFFTYMHTISIPHF